MPEARISKPMCRYYKPEMEALRTICKAFYRLEDCICGGLLHIVLDDDNMDDGDITFCIQQYTENFERPEATLGILIGYELLKMPLIERKIFDRLWNRLPLDCYWNCNCGECEYLREEN